MRLLAGLDVMIHGLNSWPACFVCDASIIVGVVTKKSTECTES